ncbi:MULTISPECIES: hypothetical protein [unclassified Bradyrhizobium]
MAAKEEKSGIREGHYLLDGVFVTVWLSFYPKTQWWIADAARPRGERIEGTSRKLDDQTRVRLKSWL